MSDLVFFWNFLLTFVSLVMYTKRFVYVPASHSASAASVGVDLAGRTSPSDWRRGEGSARRGAAGGQPGTAEQRTRLVRPHRYHTYTEAVRSHFYKIIVTKAWLFWEGQQNLLLSSCIKAVNFE